MFDAVYGKRQLQKYLLGALTSFDEKICRINFLPSKFNPTRYCWRIGEFFLCRSCRATELT